MRKVLLDTSFLVKCAEYGIDCFSEIERVLRVPYELLVVSGTVEELERLSRGDSRRARTARVALLFARKVSVLNVPVEGIVDDRIVVVAQSEAGCIVATHDAELKRRVRAIGAQLLVIRQQKYLVLIG